MNSAQASSLIKRYSDSLHAPVDGASLALFRILFGLVALTTIAFAWPAIGRELITPDFHFSYELFGWLKPWPGQGMYWQIGGLGVCAVLVSLGLFYRPAAVLFFLGYGYVYFLDQARYSNSGYWLLLAAFLLCWLPANRTGSLDAKLFRSGAAQTVPRWAPLAVAALVAVPLLYTGLLRLNWDWLTGYPFRLWFPEAFARHSLRAQLPQWLASPEFAQGYSIAATAIHLALVPMLLWRRTRATAVVLYLLYYAGLSFLFQRLIVSPLVLAGFVVFFAPDWPRRAVRVLARRLSRPAVSPDGAAPAEIKAPLGLNPSPQERITFAVLALFFAFHLLFPARAWLYPGIAAWTGDGYRFAWREMLDDKSCDAQYTVKDPATGQTWNAVPRVEIAGFQLRELAVRPDLLPQFARRLQTQWLHRHEVQNAQVFARIKCSLNSRPPQLLLDPELDLTQVERSLGPTEWVTKGDKSMPPGWARPRRR